MSLEAMVGDCTWDDSREPRNVPEARSVAEVRSVATQSIYYVAASGRIESRLPDLQPRAARELAPRPLRGLSCRLSGGRASCWPDPDTDATVLAVSRASGASQVVPPCSSIVFRVRRVNASFEHHPERAGPQGFYPDLFRPPRRSIIVD